MTEDNNIQSSDFEEKAVEFIRTELTRAAPKDWQRLIEKFVLAALGSIPWVGGFLVLPQVIKLRKEV